MGQPKLAMIGMAVMGSNFAQNFAEKGVDIALFNRTAERTREVYEAAKREPYAKRLHPVYGTIEDLVKLVGKDGTYLVMVKAGAPTEEVIDHLAPLLGPGSMIVDCANSDFHDTIRRSERFAKTQIHFFGTGVSGGEEGARHGPSIMPGGTSKEVYDARLKPLLEKVAAKAPQDGAPCVAFMGNHGAGHFVKMVHNSIEYADMELIAEAYDFMHRALGMSTQQIADTLEQWNRGRLQSYLIEITVDVLRQKDAKDKKPLVDKILDAAQMKGTGTWTLASSLAIDAGVVPLPGIYAAVATRAMSWDHARRARIGAKLSFPIKKCTEPRAKVLRELESALYTAKIACYAQGFDLMLAADKQYGFGGLDIASIAKIWRDGCIIRARFLADISAAYKGKTAESLLTVSAFTKVIKREMSALAKSSARAAESNIPFMAFDASRAYLLQSTSKRLPMNLTQAQRDFFGAHTYKRIDKKGTFHTEWSTATRAEKKLD